MAGYAKGKGKFDGRQCNDLSAHMAPKGGMKPPKGKMPLKHGSKPARGGY